MFHFLHMIQTTSSQNGLQGACLTESERADLMFGVKVEFDDPAAAPFPGLWVTVRVADQGIGIPQSQLRRIFKRFYRVPGRFMARVKGTGLGLFIVESVVKKHGGRVYAESAGPGHGSTFTVQLPRV